MKQGAETGYIQVETPTRISLLSVLKVTEEVRTHCFSSFIVLINCIIVSVRYYQYISVLTVTEEVRTHCFSSFIVLINCIIVSIRYYQYISVLTVTEEFLLAKSSKFLIPTAPISTL